MKAVRSDGPKDLVFQSIRKGTTMHHQNIVRRHLRLAAENLKMDPKKTTWRSLRTSRARWMCEAGVDPKSVQASRRHSRISITMDIYAQFVPESQRRASTRTMEIVNKRIEWARLAKSAAVN
jgi:site-specific recombinase XerD